MTAISIAADPVASPALPTGFARLLRRWQALRRHRRYPALRRAAARATMRWAGDTLIHRL